MHVVRDVLDKAVVDPDGREIGRVDGILIDDRGSQPPRLAAVLIGPSVLGSRLHAVIGRAVVAIEHAAGIHRGRPVHIPFADLAVRSNDVVAPHLHAGATAATVVERRLRAWLQRLPGNR